MPRSPSGVDDIGVHRGEGFDAWTQPDACGPESRYVWCMTSETQAHQTVGKDGMMPFLSSVSPSLPERDFRVSVIQCFPDEQLNLSLFLGICTLPPPVIPAPRAPWGTSHVAVSMRLGSVSPARVLRETKVRVPGTRGLRPCPPRSPHWLTPAGASRPWAQACPG